MFKLECQFVNGEAIAALIAARRETRELAARHPELGELMAICGLLDKAYEGLDLAVITDARRSVQLPRT
jgi:uncharacterized membrane protein YebE (DUF533 family)